MCKGLERHRKALKKRLEGNGQNTSKEEGYHKHIIQKKGLKPQPGETLLWRWA
jgi:hypothetical protein